jgi:hypothetical protein
MEFSDREAADFLKSPSGIRDTTLAELTIREVDGAPLISMTFDRAILGGGLIDVLLTGIDAFDFSYSSDYVYYDVGFMKVIWRDDEGLYLSLDPYDERDSDPSEQDNDVFRARKLSVRARTGSRAAFSG